MQVARVHYYRRSTYKRNRAYQTRARCGRLQVYVETSEDWDKVTCKQCQSHRPKHLIKPPASNTQAHIDQVARGAKWDKPVQRTDKPVKEKGNAN